MKESSSSATTANNTNTDFLEFVASGGVVRCPFVDSATASSSTGLCGLEMPLYDLGRLLPRETFDLLAKASNEVVDETTIILSAFSGKEIGLTVNINLNNFLSTTFRQVLARPGVPSEKSW
jgi:hypothetical protein